ncbi:MAG: AI-2E family transporter, partial [Clostridiales bacterium]
KQIIFYILLGVSAVAFFYYIGNIYAGLGWLAQVAKPIIYGLSFAFILNVLMCPIERRIFEPLARKSKFMAMVKRPFSIVATFLVLLGILALVFLLVLPRFVDSIISLASYLPKYIEDFAVALNKTLSFYGFKGMAHLDWESIMSYGMSFIGQVTAAIKQTVPEILNFTVGVTSGVITVCFGFIFAFYMLAQKETLLIKTQSFMKAYLPEKINEKVFYVSSITNETFKNFLGGQCLDSLCLGLLTFITLTIIQMPYALVIAVTVGVTNMIPIVGPILGTIPCAFIILVISPIKAVILVITIIVLQQLESNLIYPRIVGGRVGLDGLWVLMAVLVGGNLAGLMGIILGVPIFAVLGKIIGTDMEKRLGYCGWEKKQPKEKKSKQKPVA